MLRLESLRAGQLVRGVLADQVVTVVSVEPHGDSVVTLTYRDAQGRLGERLLFRDDEASLTVVAQRRGFTFDGDGHLFRLVAEARRIRLAHLYDPMLAVHLSRIDPLPHQIEAVYGHLLPRQPLRFLLADDPGAGKTIMAGLYIKELMLRGDLRRCLVVAPGGLVAQWQDELAERFGIDVDILTRDVVEASHSGNPFIERDLLVARLDHLARNDDLQDRLARSDWDLVVVDEAHRMSAHFFGAEVRETRRYRLGKLLGRITRHLLLMTATPHAGKEEDFQLFMALLDEDRFAGKPGRGGPRRDSSDLMRRMVKERLLTFEGKPLFPERRAYSVPYPLTGRETELYEEVTAYVREEMNRADRLRSQGEGRRGNRVGFALTVLQRRLASSPEAIYQSLVRRAGRLAAERDQLRSGPSVVERRLTEVVSPGDTVEELDDLDAAELEAAEEELVDSASAARTIAELDREIVTLEHLADLARRVRDAGTDRKWTEFAALLDDAPQLRRADGSRRKLIVFTEHRDTLEYLVRRLRTRLGRPEAVVAIHGGTRREERRAIQETFSQDPGCVVLVATDAAGEGINLQQAHLVVNYDLPWNPNRIEQRFGRVHRIGQREVCHMWNLVAADTREGEVYLRLLSKLEEQRAALGGQVFDMLGEVLPGRSLRDLLMDAVRYGDLPDTRARLDQVIDARVGDGLAELVRANALASDVMSVADVQSVRLRMEEAAARRLQPHHVSAFFLAALEHLGGRAVEREPGRYEVTRVPTAVRATDRQRSRGRTPVLTRYERVCFDKEKVAVAGRPGAELVAPGHPLLEAVIDAVLERDGDVLRRGTVLVDEAGAGETISVLAAVDSSIADGRTDPAGRPLVVSRRVGFVALGADGSARDAGPAPYLDLRPATPEELSRLRDALTDDWLHDGIEDRAVEAAVRGTVPDHLREVRERTAERVARVRSAVHERLSREIGHWDRRAAELRELAAAGRQPRMNPDRAESRAEELQTRLHARMAELDREAQLHPLPPAVTAGLVVVPAALLATVEDGERPAHAREVAEVDARAVAAVLRAERAAGREPEEMTHSNPGYDVRSRTPDGHYLFIEVKGRIAGADTVSVSRSQILHGLNVPDRFVLALVSVSPDGADGDEVRYVREPFTGLTLGFAQTRAVFDWHALWQRGSTPEP